MSASQNQDGTLPLVLAISGASGVIYGMRLLQYLIESNHPVDLIISSAAIRVMKEEHDLHLDERAPLPGLLQYLNAGDDAPVRIHPLKDYGASVSSGSYRTRGMVVLPCSIGTLGAIANGLTENLIHRAAQVTLKERRRLMVVIREMPFGQLQLKNMLALSEAGATVACASPGFYHKPVTIQDQIDFVVGRVLDQFDFDNSLFKRWKSERGVQKK